MVGLLFKNLTCHYFTSCQSQRHSCWARSVFVETSSAQTLFFFFFFYDKESTRKPWEGESNKCRTDHMLGDVQRGQLLRSRYLLQVLLTKPLMIKPRSTYNTTCVMQTSDSYSMTTSTKHTWGSTKHTKRANMHSGHFIPPSCFVIII